jgi:hypothetical protein
LSGCGLPATAAALCSAACGDAAVLQQLFLEDHWQGLSATQFDTTAMQFSADAFAKHGIGNNFAACRGQESDCRNNDKGIQNKHGVWFIPNQRINEPGNLGPFGRLPPPSFWNLKCNDSGICWQAP